MQRFASRAIADLLATAGAVGDQQRRRIGRAHRRQQRELGHRHRDLEMFGLVAEGAGHAAAARLDGLDLEVGDARQQRRYGREGAVRLLVAVAVDQRLRGHGPQAKPRGTTLGDEELLEQERAGGHRLRIV